MRKQLESYIMCLTNEFEKRLTVSSRLPSACNGFSGALPVLFLIVCLPITNTIRLHGPRKTGPERILLMSWVSLSPLVRMVDDRQIFRLADCFGKICKKNLELTKQTIVSYQTFRSFVDATAACDIELQRNESSRLQGRGEERIDFTQT